MHIWPNYEHLIHKEEEKECIRMVWLKWSEWNIHAAQSPRVSSCPSFECSRVCVLAEIVSDCWDSCQGGCYNNSNSDINDHRNSNNTKQNRNGNKGWNKLLNLCPGCLLQWFFPVTVFRTFHFHRLMTCFCTLYFERLMKYFCTLYVYRLRSAIMTAYNIKDRKARGKLEMRIQREV